MQAGLLRSCVISMEKHGLNLCSQVEHSFVCCLRQRPVVRRLTEQRMVEYAWCPMPRMKADLDRAVGLQPVKDRERRSLKSQACLGVP